jgi:hypothetical protein
MPRLKDVTHVGRTVDPRHPNTRIALLAAAGAAAVVFALDSTDLRRAFSTGLATFAAWAIARELDPDRPRSAIVAALLVPIAVLTLGTPTPAPLYITVVTTRILTRTTGLAPKTTDLAVLTVAAIAVADTPAGWAASILLAFAMVRDAALPGEPPPNAGLWGAALAVGVTIRVALADGLGAWDIPTTVSLAVFAAGLAGAVVVLRPTPVLSLGDYTKLALEPARLREGALFGILTGIVTFVAAGDAGIVAISPLFGCFAAVAAIRLLDDAR